ncbi:DUF1761 domain-containing protein [Consotaella aegiceratis]|uniref:DUF1761 domain-containing protein n=1 Tax=Consotaella aegiceratis TaxID=3097961 RepID=UPI002F426E58
MGFASLSFVAIVVAALLASSFSFLWHRIFDENWMTARGYSGRPKIKPGPLAIVFVAELVLAAVLAGLTMHIGGITLWNAFVNAAIVWAGVVLTTMVVDHSYEARPRALTFVNAGHWAGVLLIMTAIIGLFG